MSDRREVLIGQDITALENYTLFSVIGGQRFKHVMTKWICSPAGGAEGNLEEEE
jgi:hypothetical protein